MTGGSGKTMHCARPGGTGVDRCGPVSIAVDRSSTVISVAVDRSGPVQDGAVRSHGRVWTDLDRSVTLFLNLTPCGHQLSK